MSFLSTNIKYLRQQNNLSQADIAKIVGKKSHSLVSQWESDDRKITTDDIIKLSDYFDIPMDKLVGEDLRLNNSTPDEFDILLNKYKDILSDSDKVIIKSIITERKKEIDKNLDI